MYLKKNYVFTYGTLMRDERNHHLLQDEDYFSDGSIEGYYMFNLGRYPGILPGKGTILGELYLIDDETLAKLDILEEEGSLYSRIKSTVYTSTGIYEAFVYVYLNNNLDIKVDEYSVYSWKMMKE